MGSIDSVGYDIRILINRQRLHDCWRAMGLRQLPELRYRLQATSLLGTYTDDHAVIINALPAVSLSIYTSSDPTTKLYQVILGTLAHESRHAWQRERFGARYLQRCKDTYVQVCSYPALWWLFVSGLLGTVMMHNLLYGLVIALPLSMVFALMGLTVARELYRRFGYLRDPCERDAERFARHALANRHWRQVVSVSVAILESADDNTRIVICDE